MHGGVHHVQRGVYHGQLGVYCLTLAYGDTV